MLPTSFRHVYGKEGLAHPVNFLFDQSLIIIRVRTGPGNPGKSWNFIIAFSRTGKSWKSNAGPGKSWKSVKLNKVIKFSLKQMSKVFLVFL